MVHRKNDLITFCVFTCWQFANTVSDEPCIFNELKCRCEWLSADQSTVYCQSLTPALPTFTPPPNVTYKLNTLTVTSDSICNIPANYFAIFETVEILKLEQSTSSSVIQKWNDAAFDTVSVSELTVTGLCGLLPPPVALRRLGARNLSSLTVSNARMPIRLEDHCFDGFYELHRLEISKTEIEQIGDHAFDGLESSLLNLYLNEASLTEVPYQAIKSLKKLNSLVFSNNPIATVVDLAILPELKYLHLDKISLTALDLSLFGNLISIGYINLSYNRLLKNITATTPYMVRENNSYP